MLLTTETAQPNAAGPPCASSSCSRHLTALSVQSSSKPCRRVRVTPLQCCFLGLSGHGVVFSILKGSTSGGSCSWRNLFCSLLSCSLPVCPPLMEAEKSSMSDLRESRLKPNNTYSEREKCGTTPIPRQWWKHGIDRLMFSSDYQYLLSSSPTFLLVACSMLCLV